MRAGKIVAEDCPVMPLIEPVGFTLIHPWLQNIKPHPIAYGLGKYHRLDVEARARAQGDKGAKP